MSKQIMEYRKCPTCGIEFIPKSPIHKYCCFTCQRKSYYKSSTKIKNPVGIIENILINYTEHLEGNHKVTHDEIIWFVSKHKMGNLNLETLKKRKWKVSDILLFNGYKIENPTRFDKEFKKLVKKLI